MNQGLLCLPFAAQGAVMALDEFYFHARRRLGRWERIGHPVDTASYLLPLALVGFLPYSPGHLSLYAACAAFSCLLITKDEWVHTRECLPAENWLHALLFVLHPVALLAAALLWPRLQSPEGALQRAAYLGFLATVLVYLVYQALYWNFFSRESRGRR